MRIVDFSNRRRNVWLASLLLPLFIITDSVQSEDAKPPVAPKVLMCVPLGATPGQTTKIKARGLRLDEASDIRTSTEGVTVKFVSHTKVGLPASLTADQAGDTQVEFELTIAADRKDLSEAELVVVTPHGEAIYRLPLAESNIQVTEAEPNGGYQEFQALAVPQLVLGQFERPFDVDVYAVELTAGQTIRASVAAQAFGSSVDAMVSVVDDTGSTLATNDDQSGDQSGNQSTTRDPAIEITASKAGRHYVVVQDANDLGGEAHPYRLLVTTPSAPLSFIRDIAPIVQQHCVACHGAQKSEGGYRMDTYEHMIATGDSDLAGFMPHQLDKSESFRRITSSDADERMPLDSDPLAAEQIERLRNWIEQGSRFDGTSPSATLLSQLPPIVHPTAPDVYPAPLPVTAIAYSPKSNALFISGYHEVTVWSQSDGKLLRRIGQVAERVYAITFSPSGDQFAVACGNPGELGEVRLFSLDGQLQKVLGVSADVIHDVAYNPAGNRLAIAGSDAKICIFDLPDGNLYREIRSHLDWVLSIAWSPDGSKLASASRDKTAKVFQVETGQQLVSYLKHEAPVRGVMFHPSGEAVYTSGANHRWDRWTVAEAKSVRDMGLGGEGFKLFGFADHFLVPSSNSRVNLIKAEDGERVREFQGGGQDRFLSVTADPATDRVAAGTQRGDVVVWELSTGKKLLEFSAAPK